MEMKTVNDDKTTDSKKDNDGIATNFDDILEKIGSFGWFQVSILTVCVLISWTVGSQNLCPVFTINIPKHRSAVSIGWCCFFLIRPTLLLAIPIPPLSHHFIASHDMATVGP